ncbi:MAG: hypothetical protein AAGA03_11830 [Planctomycetota bacterium]
MLADQAIFTSADRRDIRGYQITASSSGIDRDLEQELARWSPSNGSLVGNAADAESLNVFRLQCGRTVLSRTCFAGPEYSNRGGLRVMTLMLVLPRDGLVGYQFDSMACLQSAMALGHLRLTDNDSATLPQVELPDRPIGRASSYAAIAPSKSTQDWFATLRQSTRSVVIGCVSPIGLLHQWIQETIPEERGLISFCTGLNPSGDRPFRLAFLPRVNASLKRRLTNQSVQVLTAPLPAN